MPAVGPIVATIAGPGTDNAEGEGWSAVVDVYWRPGCGYSMALERALDKREVAVRKHNIWKDPDAAEFVRRHAGGAETVPTVAVGSTVLVNPTADEVVAAMGVTGASAVVAAGAPTGRLSRLLSKVLGG